MMNMIVIKWKYSLFTKCLKSGSSATGPACTKSWILRNVSDHLVCHLLTACLPVHTEKVVPKELESRMEALKVAGIDPVWLCVSGH